MRHKEILSFFNLEAHPFSKEIKTQDLIKLPPVQDAFDACMLLIETRGIGLLTGPSGCGKSSLLRLVAHHLNPGLLVPFYVSHTSLGTSEFYQTLAASLGLCSQGRRAAVFRRIKEFLQTKNDVQKVHPVIFIDEAHALSADSLRELRYLTNFDYDSKHTCTILLSGHTELRQKLSLNVFTSLTNSITYSVSLDALDAESSYTYVETRISASGGMPGLFTKNALKLVHDASKGVLRSIGHICWQSLIKAYQGKSAQVERDHVQMVLSR